MKQQPGSPPTKSQGSAHSPLLLPATETAAAETAEEIPDSGRIVDARGVVRAIETTPADVIVGGPASCFTVTGLKVYSTRDALMIFEACRRGILPRVARRLTDDEKRMIDAGTVLVFDEREAKIKRWTDGRVWTPSRIVGNFLVYRELDRKLQPDQEGAAEMVRWTGNSRCRQPEAYASSKGVFIPKPHGLIKRTISLSVPDNEAEYLQQTEWRPPRTHQQHLVSYFRAEMDTQLPTPEDMEELQFLRLPVQILRIQRFRRPVKITPCDGLGYNLNESDDEEYSEHADSHTPATIASASVALLPESSTALLSTSFAAFEALAAPVVSPEAVHFGSSTSSRPVALPPRTTAISSAYTLYAYSDRHPPAPAPAPVAPLCLDPPTLSDPALAFHMSESAATAMAPSSRPTGGGLPLPSIYASNLGFPEDPGALFGIGAAMTGDGGPAHGRAAYPEAADAVARYCYNIMPPADLHAVHGSVFGARDGDSLQQPPPPAGLFAPPLHVPPEYLDMFYNLHEPRHQPQQLAHMRQWEELCQRELSLRRGRLACQPIELVHPQAVTSPPGALPPTSAAAPSQLFGDTRKGSSS